MISVKAKKSEEATNNENNGVETDPILDKIAKSRGINLQNLLKTLKWHPETLTEEEQTDIINYSSAVLPKALERKMIEMYRDNRDRLNELLFNHNARIATRLATIYNGKYSRMALNRRYFKEDFLSAARYGLWMGATRFDIDRTYNGEPIKFVTFATPWVFRYIGEMLYEKENMIVHQSLDAKAYSDSNITVGDMISDESDELSDEAFDEYEDIREERAFLDDEENVGFDEAERNINATLLQSIGERLETVVESDTHGRDDPEQTSIDATICRLKDFVRPRSGNDASREAGPGLIDAIETFCAKAISIVDERERMITLFIGRRYIRSLMRLMDGAPLPASIVEADRLLANVPKSKKSLLSELSITEDEFNRLCNHYAIRHSNEERDENAG